MPHEMNSQRQNLGYIELFIYRSIYSGPLDFDPSFTVFVNDLMHVSG